MTASDTIEMLGALEGRGIAVWLDGGWGIDALLGEQTRPHEDVDLVVGIEDVPALITELGNRGFHLAEGRPRSNFVLTDANHRKVDVHPVAFDDEGNGHYTMENDEIWIYPGDGFAGTGNVGAKSVRCLTPEVQVLCHKGYELDEDDVRDLEALHARFGVG